MKWILRSLMIILLIGALSESRAEDAATIKKQIEDLSAKLVEYQKDKARFIELEVEKKKLETELISASGQQRLDLEAKLKTAEQKLEKARQGYLAIEKTTQEIKVLKNKLEPLSSPQTAEKPDVKRDLRSLGTAAEAFAVDNNIYPDASTIEELQKIIEPKYIRSTPLRDPWGNPYIYKSDEKREKYWIICYGADGKPEKGLYDANGIPKDSAAGEIMDPNADVIFTDGSFIRFPSGKYY